MQSEIVKWPWSNDGGTDRPDADAAGGDAADAAVGRWARRPRRAGPGRDAGRQLLARRPRHGRRVVRAVGAGAPAPAGRAPRAAPARRPAAAGAIVPGENLPRQQTDPSQVCEAKVLVSQRKQRTRTGHRRAQSEAVRSACHRADARSMEGVVVGVARSGACRPLSVLGLCGDMGMI